jgi:hypothetical protein
MHVFIVMLFFGSWISLQFPFLNIYIYKIEFIVFKNHPKAHCTIIMWKMLWSFASWPNSFNLYKGFSYFQKVFGRIKLVMRAIILPLQRFLFIYVWKIGPRNVWNQAIHYDFFLYKNIHIETSMPRYWNSARLIIFLLKKIGYVFYFVVFFYIKNPNVNWKSYMSKIKIFYNIEWDMHLIVKFN